MNDLTVHPQLYLDDWKEVRRVSDDLDGITRVDRSSRVDWIDWMKPVRESDTAIERRVDPRSRSGLADRLRIRRAAGAEDRDK
jgi:hypothetical protein